MVSKLRPFRTKKAGPFLSPLRITVKIIYSTMTFYLIPTLDKVFPRKRLRGWSLSNVVMTEAFLFPNRFNSMTINLFGLILIPV